MRAPWSTTPAEPLPPGRFEAAVLPASRRRRTTSAKRPVSGLDARPAHFLCTLHTSGHPLPRNTRFQLAASLGRVGSSHRVTTLVSALSSRYIASSFFRLAWRTLRRGLRARGMGEGLVVGRA